MRPVFGKHQYHVDHLVRKVLGEKAPKGDDIGSCRVASHVQPWLITHLAERKKLGAVHFVVECHPMSGVA